MQNRREFIRCSLACPAIGFTAVAFHSPAGIAEENIAKNVLPYDNTNPVLYDNDWTNDYVDWYLMALASAGDINYVGISTSSSIPPYNKYSNRLAGARFGRHGATPNEISQALADVFPA